MSLQKLHTLFVVQSSVSLPFLRYQLPFHLIIPLIQHTYSFLIKYFLEMFGCGSHLLVSFLSFDWIDIELEIEDDAK